MGFICFVLCVSLFSFSLQAKNLVKIGNTVITSQDLANRRELLNRTMPLSIVLKDKYILDTMMLYHLALKDAHERKMESDPEAQKAMEEALFNYYLFKSVDEKIGLMNVSEPELREQYKKDPDFTFKRIVMPVNQKNKNTAKSKLSLYKTDLNNGKVSLEDVINKIGKNELSSLNGLFPKASAYSLAEMERATLMKLQPGEISPIMDLGSFIEIVELIKRHPYAEASQQRLIDSFKRDRLTEGRMKIIEDLKVKYKSIIQYYQ